MDGQLSRVAQCPVRYSETSCGWTLNSEPPYRQFVATHKLILTTRNKWGNVSEIFRINNNEVITAPEVSNFHIDSVGSTHVFLKWNVPSQLDFGTPDPGILPYPHLIYEIHIIRDTFQPTLKLETSQSQSISFFTRTVSIGNLEHFILRTNETTLNVTDLIPFQGYKFKIRCIVSAVLAKKKDHTPFWSQFVQAKTITLADGEYNFDLLPFFSLHKHMAFYSLLW